jgi:phosphoribosylpyrophosphate synthetase
MDLNSLPTQRTKQYLQCDFVNVMYLYDYHPWDGGQNPRIDKITHTLLNLKNASENRRRPPVNFFTKVLTNSTGGLSRLLIKQPYVFAIVPSHQEGHVSPGLSELIGNVREDFNFTNYHNPLYRHSTVPKAATGGPRNAQLHMNSIAVVHRVEGQTVILFDDITTTGSSLLACKELLLQAGAAQVAMIALGKTYSEQ